MTVQNAPDSPKIPSPRKKKAKGRSRRKKALPIGRPCLLAPEVKKRLLNALKVGNYRKHAALYAGISPASLFFWLKRGREGAPGDEEFLELLDSVEGAEAAAVVRNVQIVQSEALAGNLTAATWWLERKCRKQFGRRDQNRVEMSGPNGAAIAISSGVVVLPAVTDDDG